MKRPQFIVLGLIMLIAVTIGVGTAVQQQLPAPVDDISVVEPIRSVTLLCPEPGAGGDLAVRVTAAVVPDQIGQAGEGQAQLITLPGRESD